MVGEDDCMGKENGVAKGSVCFGNAHGLFDVAAGSDSSIIVEMEMQNKKCNRQMNGYIR